MTKIRIGNDMRILIKIYPDSVTHTNVHNIRAYIINSSEEKERKEKDENAAKFVGRFPKNPLSDVYTPTSCNINCCGEHTYNVLPRTYTCACYHGFGCKPNWDEIYRCECCQEPTRYLAEVLVTQDPNVIAALFPVKAQLLTGTYSICVVYDVYEPGFNPDNHRTITIDFNDAFELVGPDEPASIFDGTLYVGFDEPVIEYSENYFYINYEGQKVFLYVPNPDLEQGTIYVDFTLMNGHENNLVVDEDNITVKVGNESISSDLICNFINSTYDRFYAQTSGCTATVSGDTITISVMEGDYHDPETQINTYVVSDNTKVIRNIETLIG